MSRFQPVTFSVVVLASLFASGAAMASDRTFTIGGEDKNNNITFQSESDFETILGHSNTASGRVVVDFDAGTGSVDVHVPAASLDTGIELRNKHLQSSDWLDAKKFPEVRFVTRSASKAGDGLWDLVGDFSVHGVPTPMTVRAKVKPIPSEAAKAAGLGKGEWLRVSTSFEVKLSDHGVAVPSKLAGRVSDLWTVKINLFVNAKG